jgi:hypothetical protein
LNQASMATSTSQYSPNQSLFLPGQVAEHVYSFMIFSWSIKSVKHHRFYVEQLGHLNLFFFCWLLAKSSFSLLV